MNGLKQAQCELICVKAAFTQTCQQHVAGIRCGQDIVEAQIIMIRDSLLPAAHRKDSRARSVLRRQSHHALHHLPLVQRLCLVIVELLHHTSVSRRQERAGRVSPCLQHLHVAQTVRGCSSPPCTLLPSRQGPVPPQATVWGGSGGSSGFRLAVEAQARQRQWTSFEHSWSSPLAVGSKGRLK